MSPWRVPYEYWFFFNSIVLFMRVAGFTALFLPANLYAILFGFLGLLFFLFNWTRHAVFSTIRTSSNRPAKIRWVNLSKVIRPYHRWIGTSALVMIIIHAVLSSNVMESTDKHKDAFGPIHVNDAYCCCLIWLVPTG